MHVRRAKEYPPHSDRNESERHFHRSKRSRSLLWVFHAPETSLESQEQSVIGAPKDEYPIRSMPKAAQNHGEEKVSVGCKASSSTSAERNVEVVPQPLAERDMPSLPEIGDGGGLVGRVEVLRKPDVHHSRKSHCHVRIP